MRKHSSNGFVSSREVESEIRLRKDLQEAQHIQAVISAIARQK